MSERERETPKFTGITVHRDPRGRFAVRYPTGWQTFEIREETPLAEHPEGPGGVAGGATSGDAQDTRGSAEAGGARGVAAREGIGFAPDPTDPATVFTVWAAPLGERVLAEDLEVLKAGVDEGLAGLADCRIEAASDDVFGNLIRFERIYTFREDAPGPQGGAGGTGGTGVVRKRKQWLLYVHEWLICLTWQGATPDAYQHWYAMANQSFLTFELPEALWFFTDREVLARARPSGGEPKGG